MHDIFPLLTVTFAHAFGQRYELPIPLLLFIAGGALAVFVSFLVVLPTKVPAKADGATAADAVSDQPGYRWPLQVFSYIVLALLIASGLRGSQEVSENILPTLFWLIVWIVVPLLCGIIGDWTRGLNPFRHVALLTDSARLRRLLLGDERPVTWPKWLGWWPAVVLFFGLASAELIYNQTATLPAVIAGGLLGYAVLSAIMGFLFGRAWIARGEVFSVLFSTWGRLGYFRLGAMGSRGFAGGLSVPFEATSSRIAFVLLLLASVSFDGLLATPAWNRFQLTLPAAIHAGTASFKLTLTIIFIILIVLMYSLFAGFATAVVRAGKLGQRAHPVLAHLLSSLLPISFGYLLAHNLEYVVVNSQLLLPLIGNPVGEAGWPLHLPYPFNDDYEPKIHLLPSSFYWYLSVAVIILVHVVAVIIAHRYLAQNKDRRLAQRSEYPWIVAMVAYTMLSLWLLAQPLVK